MLDERKTALIEAAARAIAEAQAAEADLRPAAEAASRELELLDERLRDLEGQRAAIAARRSVGKHAAGDAGELLLIQMDGEHLTAMRVHAEDAADKANSALAAASAAVARAQGEFERVQRRIEYAVLHERLAQLLILTITAHAATSAALAQVDQLDMQEARKGLPDIAAAAEAILFQAAKDLKDDRTRMGGRALWRPSQKLEQDLAFLVLNGPLVRGF